jgi:hypothetical protein
MRLGFSPQITWRGAGADYTDLGWGSAAEIFQASSRKKLRIFVVRIFFEARRLYESAQSE